MKTIDEVGLLLELGGVLIGSRGLGVPTDLSDYDIAILRYNLPDEYASKVSLDNYFQVLPLGNTSLIRKYNLDILIYHNLSDFEAIRTAMNYVRKYPKELLKDKMFRITVFEYALIHTGRFRNK